MAEQGIDKINRLQRRYISYQLAADLFFAAGLAGLAGCLGSAFFSFSVWWSLPYFAVIFGCSLPLGKYRRVPITTITTYLNLKYPDLEESSELALKKPEELNLLEKLQLAKVELVLEKVPKVQKQFLQRFKLGILFFLIVIALGAVTMQMGHYWHRGGFQSISPAEINVRPENVLPQIQLTDVTVRPPAYTRKPAREQDKFTLEVEDGSLVSWRVSLNVAAKQVALVFNDGQKIVLKNTGDHIYHGQKLIVGPGFYQVVIDGRASDLYQVQVIKDNPPAIHIKTPQQYTYIDAGEAREVHVSASVDDDYGITDAFIYATVAKGSGEAVKFKEQKIDFGVSFNGRTRHEDLQKLISLPSLNMEPGDELYFYVQARDNHNQLSQTEVYIVSIQDTAQLLSMDGLISGVNVKPEYFRSERQIIMDSEKLLRDRDSISKESFNNRSNDIGTDQKLLRLRYGKFLGEESESDIDPKDSGNDAVSDPNNFGNAAVVLDKYTDKHDNAEDAQFFDPGVKAQLKATLTEMWKAELQLRLNSPQAALPFAYKALRLLKDLQQKSRMYVAKTAYNPAPLKMDKRLTGDLGKIIQPSAHQDLISDNSRFDALKNAIGVLEQLNTGTTIGARALHTLQVANQQLTEKAAARPEIYLPAISAFRRILAKGVAANGDLGTVEKALQRLLPESSQLPMAVQNSADMGLSKAYYQNLDRK